MAPHFSKRLLAMVLTLAPAYNAPASEPDENYPHNAWTQFGSLESTRPQAITQDVDGYLWLGFAEGLVRFDGTHFLQWSELGGAALPERNVTALCASRDGSLWLGFSNLGGVSRIRDGTVRHYSSSEGVPEGTIQTLFEDREGTIWAGGWGGAARFHGDRWELMSKRGLPETPTVRRFHQSEDGNLWVGSDRGLFRLDAQTSTFEHRGSFSSAVLAVVEDVAGAIWLTDTRQGFRRLNQTGRLETPQRGWVPGSGQQLLRDRRGHLWAAMGQQGLLHVRSQTWDGSPSVERHTRQNGLTGDRIAFLFEDRDGSIWVGTDRGLDRLAPGSSYSVESHSEFGDRQVRVLTAARDGSMWTGTDDGLHRSSDTTSRWYHQGYGLPGDAIEALHSDADGTVWVATDGGIARFRDGRFLPVPLPRDVQLRRVLAMSVDANQGLWLCAFSGLYRLQGGAVTSFEHVPEVRGQTAMVVYTDSDDTVWVGFLNGTIATFRHGKFVRSYGPVDGLSGGRISALFEDDAGSLWIGTPSGLGKFVDGRVLTLAEQDGHQTLSVLAIAQDEDGVLWLATPGGLVGSALGEFDKAVADSSYHMRQRVLDASAGMETSPLWVGQPTAARTASGELWFVTESGVAVVDTRRLPPVPLPPRVRIDRVIVNGEAISTTSGARLSPLTSRLQVDYSAPAFEAPGTLRFRHMLEGLDRNWHEAVSDRHADYTNLPSRSYRFRVAASYDGTSWTEPDEVWAFSVPPSFYETTQFYIMLVVVPSAVLWGLWRWRMTQMHRQHALVLAERSRMGQELHDSLLGGMAGVALALQSISETLDASPSRAKAGLGKARATLEHSIREARLTIRDLRDPTREIHDLSVALRRVGERTAADTDIKFTLRVYGTPTPCTAQVKRTLLAIGREAIANAVQHAEATQIRVEISYGAELVQLRVNDDGHGFDPDVAQLSDDHWGLDNMRERAEQIGASLEFTSSATKGTLVEVVSPYTQAITA